MKLHAKRLYKLKFQGWTDDKTLHVLGDDIVEVAQLFAGGLTMIGKNMTPEGAMLVSITQLDSTVVLLGDMGRCTDFNAVREAYEKSKAE